MASTILATVATTPAYTQTRGQDRLEALGKLQQRRNAERATEMLNSARQYKARKAQETRDAIISTWNGGNRVYARELATKTQNFDILVRFNEVEAEEKKAEANALAALGISSADKFGNWSIIEQGKLCVFSRSYQTGETLTSEIAVDKNSLAMTLSSPNWQSMIDKKNVQVTVQFEYGPKASELATQFTYESEGKQIGAFALLWKASARLSEVVDSQMVEFWLGEKSIGIYELSLPAEARFSLSECVEKQKARLKTDPFR
jgi:hypothetical protein